MRSFFISLVLSLSSLDCFYTQIVFPQRSNQGCTTRNGSPGSCRPLNECLKVYTQIVELQQQRCQMGTGLLGVCCPNSGGGTISVPGNPAVPIPPLQAEDLRAATRQALQQIQVRVRFEQDLFTRRIIIQPGTAAEWHLQFFPTSPAALSTGSNALQGLQASINLVQNHQLTPEQGRFALPTFSFQNTDIAATCPRNIPCDNSAFRTMDGSCNNLQRPEWGKTNEALQRILPPKYGDGVNSPRLAENGAPLPSARLVSSTITSSQSIEDPRLTLIVMQWGQFIDHDITHMPVVRGVNMSGITCCRDGNPIDPTVKHPDCFAIEVPPQDAFYGPQNQRCMEFVRSLPAVRPQCTFGPREQMNQVTTFLDGSAVYGSSAQDARDLRAFRGGLLRVQNANGRSLMPPKTEECSDFSTQRFCFRAGDGRANEQPQLAMMHTIWVREHNRIASTLQGFNPHWDDERLYQEARRIVAAELQHITYNEFLPILLGPAFIDTFKLRSEQNGYANLYDGNINPTITNEFATAAFRVGHSLVQSLINGFSNFGRQNLQLQLHQHQFRPFELYNPSVWDSLLRGLTLQRPQNLDNSFAEDLKNHLFQRNGRFGMDLIALNIQRGRDHGLPPYNDYREVCGKQKARTWEDLQDTMDPQVVAAMRNIYATVDDVDLFIGAISERRENGALVGPTFICLIGDQFARLRRGDRFFYEEGNQPRPFTPGQLQTLRQVTLARVLCDTADDLASVQRDVFFQADVNNPRLPCATNDIPQLDLSQWAEARG